MNTYLGEKHGIKGNASIQQVVNIDDAIGKSIRTKVDCTVTGDMNGKVLKGINIKGMHVKIEDIIRDCGLYLYCKTKDNFTFALSPDDLNQFEEIA